MKDVLQRILALASALVKIIPVIIEILGDVLDDGQVNSSNSTTYRSASKGAGKKG